MKGYHGVLLDINLTNGKIEKRRIGSEIIEKYIGGRGFGAKILYDEVKPGTDPLSSENILMFMSSPLIGYPVLSASRTTIITKSPHTSPKNRKFKHSSTVSYSNFGGFFGAELRFAGYDGIIIRGKASSPAYIYIKDDKVEIRSAKKFWGMGTDELDKALREELKDKRVQTIYIGPSGENLVEYASVIHTVSRAAGRGGVGAVMGSKNLKAIVVRGTGTPPPIADVRKLNELLNYYRKKIYSSERTYSMRRYGTSTALRRSSQRGSQAVKNFREGTFSGIKKIDGYAAEKTVWTKHHACFACPLSCKKSGVVSSGKYKGISHDGPEYETGTMLGANLLIDNLEGLLKIIYLADDYGVDAISVGNTIGFLMEAYEKGYIDLKFLSGIDLKWGNVDAVIKILELITKREGIGELASHGVKYLSEKIGNKTSVFAMHVKGHELAAWNVHVAPYTGVSYATANRGACHLNGGNPTSQDRHAVLDSLGMCFFAASQFGKDGLLKIFEAITGMALTYNDFILIGERIFNTERAFNVREGFTIDDDVIPERFFKEPLSYGPKKGAVLSKDEFYSKIMKNYYNERGWNPKTGIPLNSTLKRLSII